MLAKLAKIWQNTVRWICMYYLYCHSLGKWRPPKTNPTHQTINASSNQCRIPIHIQGTSLAAKAARAA